MAEKSYIQLDNDYLSGIIGGFNWGSLGGACASGVLLGLMNGHPVSGCIISSGIDTISQLTSQTGKKRKK